MERRQKGMEISDRRGGGEKGERGNQMLRKGGETEPKWKEEKKKTR